jgi:hypothetical protein
MSTDSDEIVRLVTAQNAVEAHIWEQALQAAGIPSQVVGDYLEASVGDVPGLNAELWVHRSDVERAREILSRSRMSRPDEETGE